MRLLNRPGAWVLSFVALQAAALGWLASRGLAIEESLAKLMVLGLVLPGLCWLITARLPPPEPAPGWRAQEALPLVLLVLWVALAMGPLRQAFGTLAPMRGDLIGEAVNTVYKMAVFVGAPWLALRAWHGHMPGGGAPRLSWPQALRVLVLVSLVAWVLQAGMGRQLQTLLRSEGLAGRHWLIAALVCWAWMSVEAGLVEEFFFRRWLQSRLQAWSGSEWAGLLGASLLFGLAHVPGMWMRGAGVVEGLGASPSLADCLAYAVGTHALAGLMFGVLWLRTRSLLLCVLAHGMFDTPAHLGRFMVLLGF